MDRSQAPESLPRDTGSRQVVVGDIPQEPPGFQLRTDLLAELDRSATAAPTVHTLTGMPGVGKTQLAAALARAKLAAGWHLVAWVNAQNTRSLVAGLSAVADAAQLSRGGPGRGGADPGQAVRQWLEADGERCLLVFDDAEDPGALRPFVPTRGAALVLITSTTECAAHLGTPVPVDVFTADEALAFLVARTGRLDAEGAVALATAFAHLPLALAQAAAVTAGQHLGYRAYLAQWRTAVPLDASLIREVSQPSVHRVAQAVLLSLEAIRAIDQTGAWTGAAEIMAVLSASGVRRDMLHAAGQAGVLAIAGDPMPPAVVDEALARLAEWSLLTFSLDGQTITMHRLVALVIRAELARRHRLTTVCRAVAAVLEARGRAVEVSADSNAVRDSAEQASALWEHTAGAAGQADSDLVTALLRLRFLTLYHLIELGDSARQAVAVGEPLTADLERLLGPDNPGTLNARNSLAAAYQAAGSAAEAIALFERTLVGRQRLLGADHPDTLTSQNNLAASYQAAGRVAEAILLFELNLATRERLLGADHPGTVNSRRNLAAAYRQAGRSAEAIPLLQQTLATLERLLGPGHPDTLGVRDTLAAAYRDAGGHHQETPPDEQNPRDHERRPDEAGPPAGQAPDPLPGLDLNRASDTGRPAPGVAASPDPDQRPRGNSA